MTHDDALAYDDALLIFMLLRYLKKYKQTSDLDNRLDFVIPMLIKLNNHFSSITNFSIFSLCG